MGSKKKGKRASEMVHFFPHEEGSREEGSHEGRIGTMTLAEDMRDLTQEIVNSFDARAASVAALKQETAAKMKDNRQQMKRLQHELKRKAANLHRFLGTSESARMRDFRAMHEGIRAGQEARSRQLGGMLAGCREMMSGFRRDHEAAGAHWRGMATTMAQKRASAR